MSVFGGKDSSFSVSVYNSLTNCECSFSVNPSLSLLGKKEDNCIEAPFYYIIL